MCGRINIADMTEEELAAFYDFGVIPPRLLPGLRKVWNVPPTSTVPIIRRGADGLSLDLARWWLIPSFFRKTLAEWKAATFNARVETVETASSFRQAYKTGRALMPVRGFYEWQKRGDAKQPFFVKPADNAPTLTLAALWTSVRLPDYEGLTCTVLTGPASPEFEGIHNRQPVMLDHAGIEAWLGGEPLANTPRIAMDRVTWFPVGSAVGSVKNEGPELIDPEG